MTIPKSFPAHQKSWFSYVFLMFFSQGWCLWLWEMARGVFWDVVYHDFPIANKYVWIWNPSVIGYLPSALIRAGWYFKNFREALTPLSWTALTWEQQVEGLCWFTTYDLWPMILMKDCNKKWTFLKLPSWHHDINGYLRTHRSDHLWSQSFFEGCSLAEGCGRSRDLHAKGNTLV